MWVLKRSEGSVNYIVIWAIVALLLAVGLVGIFFSIFYFFAGELTFVGSANTATLLLAIGLILLFLSIAFSSRQLRLLARFRRLSKMKDNARSGLRLAESMGVDTQRASDLYKLAEAQVGFKNIRETEKTIADCTAILESQLTLHEDRLLEKTRARVELKRDSTGIMFSDGSLSRIEKEIENGDYWEVSRLLRAHSVSSDKIEGLWFALKRAKRLGLPITKDIKEFKTILSEFNKGDFSGSRVRAVRLRNSLDSRIGNFVKEKYVKPVYQKISSFGSKGIVSEDAQNMIREAGTNLLDANIEGSMKYAKVGEESIDDAARGAIADSIEKIEDISLRAEKLGVDVSSVPPRIEIARDDLQDGRLEKSLDVLGNLETSLVQDMNSIVLEQFQTLQNSIEMLFLVPEAKLDFEDQLGEADGERKGGNFEEALKLAERLADKIRDEEKESLRAYETQAEKLQKKVEELETKGVRIEKIQKAMDVSNGKASSGDYAGAMEVILNVTEIVNRNLALHKDSVRTLEELSTLLSRTREQGIDVSDLVERMEALEESPDLEKVLNEAKEIEDLALQRMTDIKERTNVELLKMRDQLHSLLEKGVDVGDVPKLIGEAERAVEDAEFTKASKIITKAGKGLQAAIEISEGVDELISQITETFVTLERAGIPTNVFQSDLARIITQRSEESLEELTRFLDEVQTEKERMKSQARETIDESKAHVQDNPDVAFDEENEIIARASEAYDEGRYSKAFELAVEAVGRTKKKVELFRISNELCERLAEDVDRLGKAGLDAAELESKLQLCELETDPTLRLEKARALEAEIDRKETRLRQKMEWAVVEARHGISLLEQNEVSSEDLSEILDSATELIEDERFRDAEKKARNVRDLAAERIAQFREAMNRMSALEHLMERAKDMDVSLDEFEEDYSWLQSTDDYSHIIEKAGLLHDQINNLFEYKRGDVRDSISLLRDAVAKLESSGIRAHSVVEAIEKAELEISEDSIIEAMDTCNLAEGRIREVKESYGKWTDALVNVNGALDDATKAGIGVKDFLARLETLKESDDYESSLEEIDNILDDLNSRKTAMSTRTLEDIQTTRETLEGLIEEGAHGGDLLNVLKEAEKAVQDEEYLSSRQKIIEVAKAVDQLKNDHESFLTVLEQVKSEVDEAAESGFDMTDILNELKAVRESEDDYKSRIQLVSDLGQKASEIAESLSQEASQVMSDAEKFLEDLKAKGIDVDDAETLLVSAHERMGEGNTFEAKRLALEAKTLAEETSSIFREKSAAIEKAMDAIDKAALWGADVTELSDELDETLTVTDGSEALRRIRVIIEEADSLRLSLSEDAGAKLDGLRMDIQELRGKGIPVSNLEVVLRSAEHLMNDGKLGEASELIEELDTQKSKLEELWTEYSGMLERLQDEMENIEARKIDLEDIEREKAQVDSLGVTEEAIERIEALTNKVIEVKEELRESTETRLGEVRDFVNQLSEKGADVEEAIAVLYEAEEVLAEDSYLKALAKINRAADLGERIDQRRTYENKLMETEELLKVANEEGLDVSDLMDKLDDLREGDDFQKMTDSLTMIEEETNKRRNGSKG